MAQEREYIICLIDHITHDVAKMRVNGRAYEALKTVDSVQVVVIRSIDVQRDLADSLKKKLNRAGDVKKTIKPVAARPMGGHWCILFTI